MNTNRLIEFTRILSRLGSSQGALPSENVNICRVDQISNWSKNDINSLIEISSEIKAANIGELEIFGDVSGRLNLINGTIKDFEGDILSVRLTKRLEENTVLFCTMNGLETALANYQLDENIKIIRIAANFKVFSTKSSVYAPWGVMVNIRSDPEFLDRPSRLVRDQTHKYAPNLIHPWYLVSGGDDESEVFLTWRKYATKNLAFSLPTEIRQDNDSCQIVLKGARSAFAKIDIDSASADLFPILNEAVRWIYEQPRDTETKFHLLNNHLALYWRDGGSWPSSLDNILESALASAREAFAFHLNEDSKEALKSLGDLRKALQDDVGRAQAATRELLTALWRDVAIAGAVFALRASAITLENLNLIALIAAILLTFSLLTTVLSNRKFDILATRSREQWRERLYSFMRDDQWNELVTHPIKEARSVYRRALIPIFFAYAVLISALLWVFNPDIIDFFVQFTSKILEMVFSILASYSEIIFTFVD
jgi:hypothetical protein